MPREMISNHPSRVEIQDHSQIHKYCWQANVSDIRNPNLIDREDEKILNEIGKYCILMVTVGSFHSPSFHWEEKFIFSHHS